MRSDYVLLAAQNIIHRKRRSWLTIIGIFIGIAAVVGLISLGQSLDRSITQEFESIGADKIFINPGGSPTSTQQFAGQSATLDEDDLAVIDRTRGVDEAAGIVFRSTRVSHADTSRFQLVTGIPTSTEDRALVEESFTIEVAAGRNVRAEDTHNVVIGARLADQVFGTAIGVHEKVSFEDEDFRVVGIYEETGDPEFDRSAVLPLEVTWDLFGIEDGTYDYIVARAQDGSDPADVQERLERELREHRDVEEGEEDFTVSTYQDLIGSFRQILGIVQLIVVGIASISLLVGGVGIMNTMYTAVTERTREIGIMKAVGATNRQILYLFIIESGLIGLVGGLMGVLLGAGLAYILVQVLGTQLGFTITASLSPPLIGGALLFSFVVGTASGVLPARRAARMNPVEALRYE